MYIKRYFLIIIFFCILVNSGVGKVNSTKTKKPNIIFILADDLGYGDVSALNKDSKIPTPSFERLSDEGVTFTDAHTTSSICTPSRYSLMTGRYPVRGRNNRNIRLINGYGKHLIPKSRLTVASLLKSQGYKTACIGKWHLGMDMPLKQKNTIDPSQSISNGPNVNGFDYYYGISASLDFPPYIYIENNRFVGEANQKTKSRLFPFYHRAGEIEENFSFVDSLDHLTLKAINYIKENAEKNTPFFLYFPLTGPHKPVLPHERFKGKTSLNDYGDFVHQVDNTIGRILKIIDELEIKDETLLFVSSDNGSFMRNLKEDQSYFKKVPSQLGHKDDESVQGYFPENHRANHLLRGTKADIYEGGNRVPFFLWGYGLKKKEIDYPISLTDFLATVADVTGYKLNKSKEAEDSYSFFPYLISKTKYNRPPIIMQSMRVAMAIRKGDWKLIFSSGSGGRANPPGKNFRGDYQLYNLKKDLSEKNNLINNKTKKVTKKIKELKKDFIKIMPKSFLKYKL